MSFATYRDLTQDEDWYQDKVTYKRANRVNWTGSTRHTDTQDHHAEQATPAAERQ